MTGKTIKQTLFSLAFLFSLVVGVTDVQADIVADTLKTCFAAKTDAEIRVDGLLDEPAWQTGQYATGFTQTEPSEGGPATEETKVKVLYAEDAVYVGFWCFDREPDKIIRQLTRRDRWSASDYATVRFDTHHDHQSAHYFNVNAAGVQRDILFYNNNWSDSNWDAVWEGNSQITSTGWTAELRIPYSALRFSKADSYTWGLDFSRYIARNDETVRWQFVPSSETGGVSRYGHLEGIKGIDPPSRLESLPYFVSYGKSEPSSIGNANGRDFSTNIGLDVKYALTSALTLDAAINPDFGQVESDRAIISLDAFETYYSEKRPFFLEGNELFQVPEFNLFYSRRIGRAPRGYADDDDFDCEISYPTNTTILNAIKLSGKTGGGTSIGLLNATTQEEKMTYRSVADEGTHSAVVEPLANYSVARVKQDVFGNSYVGAMVTAANQKDRTNSYTATGDVRLYMLDSKYRFSGVGTYTRNDANSGERKEGRAFYGWFGKTAGKNYRWNVSADYYGHGVDWNQLGFLTRNGYWGFLTWHQLRSNKEFGPFRYLRLSSTYVTNKHLDNYQLWNSLGFNGSVGFTNNWWLHTGVTFHGDEYDIWETRGNGRWLEEGGPRFNVSVDTDQSKKINVGLYTSHSKPRGGNAHYYDIWVNFKPMANLEISFGSGYEIVNDANYWVGTVNDTLAGTENAAFGHLDNRELDFNSRGTYTFNKNLTLQWYAQFYFSTGTYDKYRKWIESSESYVDPSANETVSLSRDDFNYKSLVANLVLRWEYSPGSTLFVVWTHNRDEYATDHGDFEFSRDMDRLFEVPATNSFLIKANYWWNL